VNRSLVAGTALAFFGAAAAVVLLWLALRDDGAASAVPQERPSHFVSRTVATIARDDYATAWASLYPAHQAVAPQQEYVACELKTPLGWKLRSLRVVRVVDRTMKVPGTSERVAAKSVTLLLRIVDASIGPTAFSHTFTAVPVGAEWSWILTPSKYELYRTDACGT
jgi:hypothetical protein